MLCSVNEGGWISSDESYQGNQVMLFKVIFTDGTTEPIQANNIADAKIQATRKFRGRLIARVQQAGLLDMAARPPLNAIKPGSSE